MADDWVDDFEQDLKQARVAGDAFRTAVHRMLEYGAVVAGDSQPERRIYETITRAFSTFDNYFRLMGCRLFQDRQLEYLRLYPPGARIPGVEDDGFAAEGLRERLSRIEATTLLSLRFLYEQKMSEGQLDEDQEAAIQLDELTSVMNTTLKQGLPTGSIERQQVLRRLQRLKALRVYAESDLDSPENWLMIRPMILTLVSPDWIEKANQELIDMDADEGDTDVD